MLAFGNCKILSQIEKEIDYREKKEKQNSINYIKIISKFQKCRGNLGATEE